MKFSIRRRMPENTAKMTKDSSLEDQSAEVNVPGHYDFSVKMRDDVLLALIESVKRHPCIWQTSHVNYRSRGLRKAAWKEIAAETGLAEDVAAMKYQYMRDHFVRKMNGYPQTEESARKWQFFGPLFFLSDEVLKKRNGDKTGPSTRSSGSKVSAAEECTADSEDNQPLSATATITVKTESEGSIPDTSHQRPTKRRCTSSEDGECSSKFLSTNGQQGEINASTSFEPITERYVSALEVLVHQRLASHPTEETEEHHMGKMVERRLSQYPRKLKSKIMVKIMQIFHDADEELEDEQQQSMVYVCGKPDSMC